MKFERPIVDEIMAAMERKLPLLQGNRPAKPCGAHGASASGSYLRTFHIAIDFKLKTAPLDVVTGSR